MEYVYILDFWNRIKIGRSKNIDKRMRDLETQSGCYIQQSYFIEFLDAVLVENKMHKIFNEYRGLWEYFFNISFQELKDQLNVITENKLDFKHWYNNLTKEEKIIYLLKKNTDSYEERQALYWKTITSSGLIVRVINEKGIETERLWDIKWFNLEEMECR